MVLVSLRSPNCFGVAHHHARLPRLLTSPVPSLRRLCEYPATPVAARNSNASRIITTNGNLETRCGESVSVVKVQQ
jgi:hypothetical protein